MEESFVKKKRSPLRTIEGILKVAPEFTMKGGWW